MSTKLQNLYKDVDTYFQRTRNRKKLMTILNEDRDSIHRKNITYNSRSDGRRKYHTFRNIDGVVSCTCLGWRYHGKCWHTSKVAQMA